MHNNYIIVTGSAGFIGFSLCRELLKEGHKVIGIDNFNDYYLPVLKEGRAELLRKNKNYIEKRVDLDDYKGLAAVFKEYKIETVCNLAAQAGVRYSIDHPFVYEKSNVSGFLNILELVRHFEVPRLVYASSSSVYGGNKKVPFSEADPVDNPVSLYAATKKADELMAHCYSHLYGFQSIGLRFFTVYGPWGRPDMALWLFTEAITSGKPIKVFNYGNMKRDFTYIDDIISGVKASLFKNGLKNYEVFNLGNNNTEQLLDMISVIENELGIEAEKEMLPLQPGDVPATYADIEKAQAKLGFKPKTKIEAGIPQFIQWYKQHSSLVEKIKSSR
ncbi:MAG: GDP-mannose 4,6-dehydratase [Victivallales bacterium]|nr:GDP-mannose 4,6-dehydratase [Victivallales bacterium]